MKTTIKEITPQWAAQILETRNPHNRPVSQPTVERYAADMLAGRWVLTHQGIGFGENGDLIDGQHRLEAVVLSGATVKMLVTVGMSKSYNQGGVAIDPQDVMDGGRPRGTGQQLQFSHGWGNGNRVAAIARALALFYFGPKTIKIGTPQTLGILNTCEKSVAEIMQCSNKHAIRANSKVLAASVIYHTKHPVKAIAFLESYFSMLGWEAGCPQKALDAWRINNPREFAGGSALVVHITASALMHWNRNTKIQILRVKQESSDWLSNLNPELRDTIRKIINPLL